MIKELQLRLDPRTAHFIDAVEEVVAKQEGIMRRRLHGVRIIKRSIDARQRRVMVNLKVRAYIDQPMTADYLVPPINYCPVKGNRQAIVVGAGPGGLFAALRLIELGIKPIVLERGKNVRDRRLDVAAISRKGIVDPDSNYCFGEGGAGAYSDGKLYTRSRKRGSVERILGIFHQHGASEDILIDAHPHIGSDKLPGIIENMRNTIINCGGEVRFMTRVTGLNINANHEVVGVECATGETFDGPVILATGHSARDVYQMLYDSGIAMEEKGIAVGVRLEHPQHIIDEIRITRKGGVATSCRLPNIALLLKSMTVECTPSACAPVALWCRRLVSPGNWWSMACRRARVALTGPIAAWWWRCATTTCPSDFTSTASCV